MTATPSYSRELWAKTPGDIIHADLEFMGMKSFSGAQISLKLVDEFSNYIWVYAINSKDSTRILSLWQHLCAEFGNQFGHTVKALHSDNGTEFVNHAMSTFNVENGIYHHLTVPYCHEMNGRIERMNRTGADAVRAMLSFARLPKAYWAEAYATFAYVHNRVGKSKVNDKSPFQVLYDKKPDVSHIRTFGAVAYMRVPPEKHRKLDPKSIKCILLGYRDDAAYRLMDPTTHQIFYSCDVLFDELRTYSHCPSCDPSLQNKIYLYDDDLNGTLPDQIAKPPTKSLHRSNRPHKPTKRLLASHQQETTLHYLDTLPGETPVYCLLAEECHSSVGGCSVRLRRME
ncbi:hypothetical protein ACEPAI_4489 [Sanghuangporus weigelae]